MRNQKPIGRAVSMPKGLTLGGIASLGITMAGAAVIAKLLETERVGESMVGYAVMVLLLGSSFAGTWISQHRIKRRLLLVSLLSGGIYFALLLSITALFFGGQYEAVGVTGLLILGGSGTALLLAGRSGRGVERKKRRRVTC